MTYTKNAPEVTHTKMSNHSKEALVKLGYIKKVVSQDGKFALWNYTNKANQKVWNPLVVNSRGHVRNLKTGELVARPFPKFFNFHEHSVGLQVSILKHKKFVVLEKLDGSLGIIYWCNRKWNVNTRGSFDSDQAKRATEMLKGYDLSKVPRDITILVEIIYPKNQIVVDYGKRTELVLLAVHQTLTQYEYTHKELMATSNLTGMSTPKIYRFDSIDDIIKTQSKLTGNQEGFVVKLIGNTRVNRVKFKSVEYLKMMKLKSGLGRKKFFAKMKNGKVSVEFIESIPEEVKDEMMVHILDLETKYTEIHGKFIGQYKQLGVGAAESPQQLAKLLVRLGVDKLDRGIYFSIFKKRSIEKQTMNKLKDYV